MRSTSASYLFLFCFSGLLAGCQTPPATSVICEINSDCPVPLVCVMERCQTECVSQLDCLRGTHCAQTDHIGQCFIDQPLDHTSSPCGDMRPCENPAQICREFTCWDGCTTSADCVSGSYCRNGVCANPDSPGYGYGVHTACTSAASCPAGDICATDRGSLSVCRRPCTANADCADVAATSICAAIDDPSQPAGTMACVIGCDPVRQLGCVGRDRCEVNVAEAPGGGMATFLECLGMAGMGIQGAACGTTEPMLGTCGQNLGCAPAMADMTGGYECRRFCVLDADCSATTLHCSGPSVPGIQNSDAVTGVLHMCAP
jgi:hypothetical protein